MDDGSGLGLATELRLSAQGELRLRHRLTNLVAEPYQLLALPVVLPIPDAARELLDLAGRHMKERVPQRHPLGFGAWVREQRRGRPGHDSPLVLCAGTPGFGQRHGDVWAVHLAWSGNFSMFAERLPEGWAALGGGELLEPGEVELDEGQHYTSPWLVCAHSQQGLDGVRATYHQAARARPWHPRSPRPVVLNTWEAVYFEQSEQTLRVLADVAARVGIERFVLDDGWFGSRRDDTSGLGDWVVSTQVWPEGLEPLIEHVHALGMEFGLWIEPEMVNPDSDLARAHPDWLLSSSGRRPLTARNQHVLDVAHPDAFAYLLGTMDALLTRHRIDALKWDHNRDIVDAWHQTERGPRHGVHAQTLAVYRLLDELRARHPGVEIESCAGGGGRVDLEILDRTDRIWASDTNDPLERQAIQSWTSLLLPPELVGAHVGPSTAHTTGRVSSVDFRAGTALFGHFGVEWDLAHATDAELTDLSAWILLYKRFRSLIHTGVSVHCDHSDEAARVHGVVDAEGAEGLFAYVQLTSSASAPPPPCRLAGLRSGRVYRVDVLTPGQPPLVVGPAAPPWFTAATATATGSFLCSVGLPMPPLAPEQLFLMHVTAVDDDL